MSLRRKFKKCRQPLCSAATVMEIRAKYGRPGVSGRKRKQTEAESEEVEKEPEAIVKSPRNSVSLLHSTSKFLCITCTVEVASKCC